MPSTLVPPFRIGQGWDSHRIEAGRALILGGVRILSDFGLVGHSDADVLLHALTDAFLGALALGDIGSHFPDTDPEWKDAESVKFLQHAVGLVNARGYRPVNIDTTITLERPKLKDYRQQIRESVAFATGLTVDLVSVKFKTAERVGPVGEGRSCEASALVLLSASRMNVQVKTTLVQALRYAVIAGAVAAAFYTLVVARAAQLFQQDTAVSVAAAVRLQPHNAAYLDRLASWQPEERTELLKRSVAENPFNDDALIRLGFLAEMQDGNAALAERYYRRAAEINHMFLPRWTLTNFYFRQQRPAEFFHWTKETLRVTPYASDPVFAQMWLMTRDENTLNSAIPDRPRVLLQYAWYLANNKEFDSVPRAVERLVQVVGKDDPSKWGRNDLLATAEDHMLAAGYLKPALKVWSILQDAGWLDGSVPNDQHPVSNGDFPVRSYRHGFDWVSVENSGTRVDHFPDSPGVRVNLFGDQSEKLTLLQQYVPVAPGQHYLMKWQVQGEELNEPSGLAWHLHPVNAGGTAGTESADLLSTDAKWDFVAPAPAKLFLLTLEYARPLGTTRAHGAVTLKSVTMTRQ